MRCCRLLNAASVLEDHGLGDVTGILERQLWETWVVSLYVLLGGDSALRVVADADIASKRTLSERLKLGIDYQPDWHTSTKRLNFEQLAADVSRFFIGQVNKERSIR